MKKILIAALATAALAFAAPAFASDPTTSGTATISNGVATLTSDFSDTSTANDFGALGFTVASGATLSSISTLSADYNVTTGSCGGGSPRFALTTSDPNKNVFVYLGPAPSFTGCAAGWTSTGNLAVSPDARVDTSQLGGSQTSTWSQAVAQFGSQVLTGVSFVVDGGWSQAAKKQVVQVKNVNVAGTTYLVPTSGGGTGGTLNPAQLCKAQRTAAGSAAFNELWGTNANSRNAFGKCVSTVAHARNAGKTQEQILAAIDACKAQGKKGAALGSCVAASDGVAATKTEAQERSQSRSDDSGHGKKKGHGKGR